MRQNMEELQATQEEAARKSFEMNNYINAINNSAFVIEYDTKGYITFVNDKYLELLGVTREYLIGSHHSHKMEFTDEQKRNYDKFWDDLRNGIAKNVRNRFTVKDVSYIFEETYNPMRDEFDIVYKIIKIATNISQSN
jgi:methyl-accepting chemotaxis protein